ncbi:hypothetical protein PISMIDRAFT_681096 [Pisolithus microcarpus 441]|uniref:Uncharacterized protein n=1 Tax=Pisolithus microcarpus 441 TaxID=765257 RepID=A0A0C9YA93_9AGAM|nr:hypothetical protein PISMIDRAFT_681096 [Pisolithus microcarpus 441]
MSRWPETQSLLFSSPLVLIRISLAAAVKYRGLLPRDESIKSRNSSWAIFRISI